VNYIPSYGGVPWGGYPHLLGGLIPPLQVHTHPSPHGLWGGATFLEILSLYFELFKVKYSPPLWEGWSIARNGKMKKLGVFVI